RAGDVVAEEGSSLVALYRDTSAFPDPQRTTLQNGLRTYARLVIEQEWPSMARGEGRDPQTERALNDLWRSYGDLNLQTPWQVALGAESFKQLNDISEHRTQRLLASNE